MRPFQLHRGSVYLFGSRFPAPVIAILALTLLGTIVGAVLLRNGVPALAYVGLAPAAVWQGEIWRLLTWFFFAPGIGPISLIFWAMMLLVFGRDLCDAWGWRRFVGVYLGIGVLAGLGTCLIALAWRPLLGTSYMDSWPVIDALVIVWAFLFPTRQIMFNFVVPVSGKALAWITVALTVFFALLSGLAVFLPHMIALVLGFAYVRGAPLLRRRWMGLGTRGPQGPARRRPSHLRPVDEPDEKPRWYH
jgi:membrane associated rhomboid family serine protease